MIPRVRPASRITPDSRFDTPQGRPEADQRSKKIGIADSSAIVKGIVEGTIGWEQDPDFGYLVATSVPAWMTLSCSGPATSTHDKVAEMSTAPWWRGCGLSAASSWPPSPGSTPRSLERSSPS